MVVDHIPTTISSPCAGACDISKVSRVDTPRASYTWSQTDKHLATNMGVGRIATPGDGRWFTLRLATDRCYTGQALGCDRSQGCPVYTCYTAVTARQDFQGHRDIDSGPETKASFEQALDPGWLIPRRGPNDIPRTQPRTCLIAFIAPSSWAIDHKPQSNLNAGFADIQVRVMQSFFLTPAQYDQTGDIR